MARPTRTDGEPSAHGSTLPTRTQMMRHLPLLQPRTARLLVGLAATGLLLLPAAAAAASTAATEHAADAPTVPSDATGCDDALVTFTRDATIGDERAVALTAQTVESDMVGWEMAAWQVAAGTQLTAVLATDRSGEVLHLGVADSGVAEQVTSLTFCGTAAGSSADTDGSADPDGSADTDGSADPDGSADTDGSADPDDAPGADAAQDGDEAPEDTTDDGAEVQIDVDAPATDDGAEIEPEPTTEIEPEPTTDEPADEPTDSDSATGADEPADTDAPAGDTEPSPAPTTTSDPVGDAQPDPVTATQTVPADEAGTEDADGVDAATDAATGDDTEIEVLGVQIVATPEAQDDEDSATMTTDTAPGGDPEPTDVQPGLASASFGTGTGPFAQALLLAAAIAAGIAAGASVLRLRNATGTDSATTSASQLDGGHR